MNERKRTTASPATAGTAHVGLVLAHDVDGENVGIEISHIEPCDDGQVLLVLVGGATRRCKPEQPLHVMSRQDAEAARERRQARQRRVAMIAALRKVADLAEAGLPLPTWRLSIRGLLDSPDQVQAAAAQLGSTVSDRTDRNRRYWSTEHLFNTDNPEYGSGVEITLTCSEAIPTELEVAR